MVSTGITPLNVSKETFKLLNFILVYVLPCFKAREMSPIQPIIAYGLNASIVHVIFNDVMLFDKLKLLEYLIGKILSGKLISKWNDILERIQRTNKVDEFKNDKPQCIEPIV